MDKTDMKIMNLIQRCGEQEHPLWQEMREELIKLLEVRKKYKLRPEQEVRAVFLELGAPDHLSGHPYAVQAILLALEERELLQNLTQDLYPNLADRFGTSPARIERSIRHLVEVTWMRGDLSARERYFGNIISPERGKPTNGEFLARLTNAVRERLQAKSVLYC